MGTDSKDDGILGSVWGPRTHGNYIEGIEMFEGWHDGESHAKEEDHSLHVGLVGGCM